MFRSMCKSKFITLYGKISKNPGCSLLRRCLPKKFHLSSWNDVVKISLVDITSPNSPNYPTRDSWGFGGLVFSSPICREIKWKKSSPSSWDITEPVRMKLMQIIWGYDMAMTMVHLAHRWKKRAPSFHRFSMDVSLPCRCPTAVVPLSAPEVLRRPRGASTELDSPSAAAKDMCRRYNAPAPYGSFIVRTSAR